MGIAEDYFKTVVNCKAMKSWICYDIAFGIFFPQTCSCHLIKPNALRYFANVFKDCFHALANSFHSFTVSHLAKAGITCRKSHNELMCRYNCSILVDINFAKIHLSFSSWMVKIKKTLFFNIDISTFFCHYVSHGADTDLA